MSRVTGKILGMSLRHALLGLLAEHPASGYELTKQFERSLAHVWSAKHSQIYPELAKMAAAGWLEVGDEGSRGRKEYTITPAGRAELDRWLSDVPPERGMRNDALLRIFFLWTLGGERAAAYLDREAAAYRAYEAVLDGADDAIAWDASGADLMGRLVLEQGRRWSRATAEWAEWAAAEVRAEHDATSLERRMPRSRRRS